jgi:hypothetical protein
LISFILNGFIAFSLALYVFYKRDPYTLFFSLLLYVTLHYGYSILAIFWPQNFYVLRESTQTGAKLTGIGFLIFIMSMLLWRYRKLLVKRVFIGVNKLVGLSCLLWVSAVIIYWIIKVLSNEFPTPLTIQNIFSTGSLCIFSLGFGGVLPQQPQITTERLEKFCRVIAIFIFLIVLIATYEMITLHAWGGAFRLESTEYVWRASSILFNPNLLGFWCVFVAVFAGYIFHKKSLPPILPITIIILCGLGIFLSGSRSSFIICFFTFSTITLLLIIQAKKLLKSKDIFLPFTAFVLPILATIIIIKGGNLIINYQSERLKALSFLADRFLLMPFEIISFISIRFSSNTGFFSDLAAPSWLSKASVISIQGRFSTGLVDNGYLAMREDTGWIGLTAWIIIWVILIWIAFRVYRRSPGVESTYSLSMIFGCALSAVFVRAFQVFPFWVLVALTLALCLYWFNLVIEKGHSIDEVSPNLKKNAA